eukprot:CAMPEP_0174275294 /NCGR_PEP_ID=MMETSP0439-20130205/59746_1 /TAXON_ID=0 /ORGANISM="Stereomyxa ramosa, Strain Chinc5" /LENGTH=303 /DNA_ID=CAMNT_0015367385 /DNA_START=13 /DNA_END=924 /DNA_ORIENTATION=+
MTDVKEQAAQLGFNVPEKKEEKKVEVKGKEMDEESNPLRGSGFYKRKSVAFTKTYGDSVATQVKLRELEGANVKGAVIMTGFPSTSLASILSTGYIREQLKLPLVGVISSYAFPPRCIIEKGIPSHSVRIFGDTSLVVVLCEFKIPTPELNFLLTEALLDFAERHECPLLLTVEGVPVEDEDDQRLRFISTNSLFSENLLKNGHTPLDEAVVGGVTGALLAEGSLAEVDVACLLAPMSKDVPDAKSAVTVVKTVTNFVKEEFFPELVIDTTSLENKANDLHKTIENLFKSEKQNASAFSSMYG